VATFSGGINLGDTTLSNYKEGTWTPVLKKGTSADVVNGSTGTSVGIYTRVGDMLYISGYVNRAAGGTESTANRWNITGLPFNVESGQASGYSSATVGYNGMNGVSASSNGDSSRFQANTATTLELYGANASTNWSSGPLDFSFSGVFKIA